MQEQSNVINILIKEKEEKILKYISVTDVPEHWIPSQESPHGSPPLEPQPDNCDGEFKLLYITFSAETAAKWW